MSQPAGCRVRPSAGHVRGGGDQRFLHGILGVGEVAVAADDGTEDPRRQDRAAGPRCLGTALTPQGRGRLITWRTSMRWRIG